MESWWILPIVLAFFLSVMVTEVVRAFAVTMNIVDHPDKIRKYHNKPTPLLGGVAVYFSFATVTILVLILTNHFTAGEITNWHFVGFLIGGLVLILGGVIDDVYSLPPKRSIIFTTLAVLSAIIIGGIGVSKITNPFGDPIIIANQLSNILTFIWLIGMIYTTKLLDGLDGLATGIGAIGALMMALLALSTAFYQPDVALLALIAFASLIGFLLWNSSPAYIFLGEGGSTFVGYLIGILAVISGSKVATALLVMGIPILDVLFVIYRRLRLKRSIFKSAGRDHLHYMLRDSGMGDRTIAYLYYALSLSFGITTLVFESYEKLIALSILFIIMLVLALNLSKKQI